MQKAYATGLVAVAIKVIEYQKVTIRARRFHGAPQAGFLAGCRLADYRISAFISNSFLTLPLSGIAISFGRFPYFCRRILPTSRRILRCSP